MGSTAQLSSFQKPQEAQYGPTNLYQGSELWNNLKSKMGQGLDPQTRSIMEQQGLGGISGQTQAGLDKIKTGFSNSGLSKAAQLGAMSNLYGNQQEATQNLFSNIGLAEQKARDQNYTTGLAGLFNMYGAADRLSGMQNQFGLQSAGMQNEYNMNKYNVDKQNEFSWGNLLGGLLGAGGQFAGGLAGNPKLFG